MQPDRALQVAAPLLNADAIPQGTILVGEQDKLVADEARLAPGVMEEHQRQQPVRLGLVGHELDD